MVFIRKQLKMKKIIQIIMSIALISLQGCTAQKKETTMEEIIEEKYKSVETYAKRPVYGVQVNKSGCRLILEIEGSVDYRFLENNGESMMLPLNIMLLNSGKQTAIVKIYPKEGDSLITKYARVSLRFTYAPDKDSGLNEYQTIAEFVTPEDIGTKNLPYLEVRIPFEVEVPFDYSSELAKAKNLTKISNIEEKVVIKYNKIRNLCVNLDEIGYLKSVMHSSKIVFNTTYSTKDEIRESHETKSGLTDKSLYNREIRAIENYDIQYYANGKIVALWQKNLQPTLYIKGNYKYTSGKEAHTEGGDPTFLYWPEGSNELKVW